MMAMQFRDQLTPREAQEQQYQKEMLELQMIHARTMKEKDIELAKLEARFSSWLRLPVLVLKLPVLLLLGVGYIVDRIKSQEQGDDFLNMLK